MNLIQTMSDYISSLSSYLRIFCDLTTADRIMSRIFYIEKVIKYSGFETIKTSEFFFMLYFVFQYVCNHLDQSFWELSDRLRLHTNIMELSAFIVYSYWGPATNYDLNLFMSRRSLDSMDWRTLLIQLMMDTRLPKHLMHLATDPQFYTNELEKFLGYNNALVYLVD